MVNAIYAAAAVAAYLLGAVPFGYLVYRWVRGGDIRQVGSGNIGATNVGRELGFRYFILVLVLDVAKGSIAALGGWFVSQAVPCPTCFRTSLAVLCGLMAFLGHLFPIYLRFKGGKGVATGLGVALALNWIAALAALGVWAGALLVFRYVALASAVGGLALPVLQLLLTKDPFGPDAVPVTVFFLFGAGLILMRHLPNFRRMLQGVEPRVPLRVKP